MVGRWMSRSNMYTTARTRSPSAGTRSGVHGRANKQCTVVFDEHVISVGRVFLRGSYQRREPVLGDEIDWEPAVGELDHLRPSVAAGSTSPRARTLTKSFDLKAQENTVAFSAIRFVSSVWARVRWRSSLCM
jgi:hypothetical protein